MHAHTTQPLMEEFKYVSRDFSLLAMELLAEVEQYWTKYVHTCIVEPYMCPVFHCFLLLFSFIVFNVSFHSLAAWIACVTAWLQAVSHPQA